MLCRAIQQLQEDSQKIQSAHEAERSQLKDSFEKEREHSNSASRRVQELESELELKSILESSTVEQQEYSPLSSPTS
jgi:predicted nuclease with TOPRIM domain